MKFKSTSISYLIIYAIIVKIFCGALPDPNVVQLTDRSLIKYFTVGGRVGGVRPTVTSLVYPSIFRISSSFVAIGLQTLQNIS